jgi:hypothetical protein
LVPLPSQVAPSGYGDPGATRSGLRNEKDGSKRWDD